MKSFSQRKHYKPISETIQVDSMNSELRNSLWNSLDVLLWSTDDFLHKQYGESYIKPFSKALWFHYFKKPVDSRAEYAGDILQDIRKYFFECEWFEVYDFLEFVVKFYDRSRAKIPEFLNRILERELSGYRFVSGVLTDITSSQEIEMLEKSLNDSRFSGTASHLQRALELYSDREHPDYRNSIKESISAVESIARIVANKSKATLGDALKEIEKNGSIHKSLKDGFNKLYGYTSDEDGIRHAMLDEPNISAADAQFFLFSCTSFVNYLKAQI
jgi:hypothetical protein